MDEMEKKNSSESTKKYLAIISLIEKSESRLKWSEIIFILMNLMVIFALMGFLAVVLDDSGQPLNPIFILFVLFSHNIGLAINAYWMASSTRSQLKLKLRYFQARYLERMLNCKGENIISDESLFFNPAIRKVESPDGKETVLYPTEGMLRMDGFIGAAKPRTLSLMMPLMFFVIYLLSFVAILPMIFL
jgi:hypothetical protein